MLARRALLAGPWTREPGLRITALETRGGGDLLVATSLGFSALGYWSGEDCLRQLRAQWLGRHPGELLALPCSAGAGIALWDLAAQAARVPLYRLLGGKCREWVACRGGDDGAPLGRLGEMRSGGPRPAWLAVHRHRAVLLASLHYAAAWEDCAGLAGAAKAGRWRVPEGIGL